MVTIISVFLIVSFANESDYVNEILKNYDSVSTSPVLAIARALSKFSEIKYTYTIRFVLFSVKNKDCLEVMHM